LVVDFDVDGDGKITLEETQTDNRELLEEILIQLKMMNIHLQHLTDQNIRREDVGEEL
jgi:hypothetical protein